MLRKKIIEEHEEPTQYIERPLSHPVVLCDCRLSVEQLKADAGYSQNGLLWRLDHCKFGQASS
jgi:hypothetical protein